jgi:hypothetical protein
MKVPDRIPARYLAPCGIDCAACYARLREKRPCEGCLGPESSLPEDCRSCEIKACARRKGFLRCFDCDAFPCARIVRIDKRYRRVYGVDLIGNGAKAKAIGLPAFMAAEARRWRCPACGGIVSQHRGTCSECGRESPGEKKKKTMFDDPDVFPSQELIAARLGQRATAAYALLHDRAVGLAPGLTYEWNYYRDGKSWLLKATRKKKTLYWLSVSEESFRVGFYLGSKVEAAIAASGLPDEAKREFANSKGKKLRGIGLEIKSKKDLQGFEELLRIKLDAIRAMRT